MVCTMLGFFRRDFRGRVDGAELATCIYRKFSIIYLLISCKNGVNSSRNRPVEEGEPADTKTLQSIRGIEIVTPLDVLLHPSIRPLG